MPELNNQTPYKVELIPMIARDGRNVAVIIAKGTYLVDDEGTLALSPDPEPISFVDKHVGEPGESDVRIPSDLVDYKPSTDVVIIRSANESDWVSSHSDGITLEVGGLKVNKPVENRWCFGPLRRDEAPRRIFAGTYDQKWRDNRMPLLPEDFDPRHNQVAPMDQITPKYLSGNESIRITGLYSGSSVRFNLPGRVIVVSGNVLHDYISLTAVLDTLLIWPDKPRISLVWRLALPCQRKIEEVGNIYVYLVLLSTARELFGTL